MSTPAQIKYYLKNKALVKAKAKLWKKNNPQKVKDSWKRYRANNLDIIKQKNKIWKKNNPQKVNEQNVRYNKKHPEIAKLRKRNWTRKNKDRLNKERKEKYLININLNRKKYNDWYKLKYPMEKKTKRQEQQKKNWLKFKYNLTTAEVKEMETKQGGKCLICKRKLKLHIDHCHEKGIVRGLLCFNCNTGLGMFKDNVVLLSNAINYLNARITENTK